MKKMNKKGFTLAELLIVIAIIAVLIAIAIPTFSGALDNAKRQTDHANIRSAYSVLQIAKMEGGVYLNGTDVLTPTPTTTTSYYFHKDGTLSTENKKATTYALQTGSETNSCAACAGCDTTNHVKDRVIAITCTIDGGKATWSLDLSKTIGS